MINQIYNNEIDFWNVPIESEKIKEFQDKANRIKSRFEKSLSEEDLEMFEIFAHQFECISSVEKEKTFAYAFSMGILLMVDVLSFKGTLKQEEQE